MWVARDVTERKQAEEGLRHYTERLESPNQIHRAILMAQSPEPIARVALTRLRRIVPCERAGVVLFDESADQCGKVHATETSGADRSREWAGKSG